MGSNRTLRRTATALSRLGGFTLSMALLAAASLFATPAMIAADGPMAWGSIALGQGIGAITCLIVSYGWAVEGPARIANGGTALRRREYMDSVRVRLLLVWPGIIVATSIASLIARHHVLFAAAGAASTTLVCLTNAWYFAGIARPYLWLLLETLPRVAGTTVGIALMVSGFSALAGLLSTATGMVLGFVFVSIWINRYERPRKADECTKSTVFELLRRRRHGITSVAGSQAFLTAPLVIVTMWAPAELPVYALVDKVRQLVSAGLNPVVVFMQGWVPRGGDASAGSRARLSLFATAAFCLVGGAGFTLVANPLMHWLGNSQIEVTRTVSVLAATLIFVGLFDSVLAYAVMASAGQLKATATATIYSICVMIPAVFLGVLHNGAVGALCGILTGLAVRLLVEMRSMASSKKTSAMHRAGRQP